MVFVNGVFIGFFGYFYRFTFIQLLQTRKQLNRRFDGFLFVFGMVAVLFGKSIDMFQHDFFYIFQKTVNLIFFQNNFPVFRHRCLHILAAVNAQIQYLQRYHQYYKLD